MVYTFFTHVTALPDPKDDPRPMESLSAERREKILRYRSEKDRKLSLGAGLLLKHAFAKLGIDGDSIRQGTNGKPECEGIFFNLSHSHEIAVCSVGKNEIGCDVERIENAPLGVAERYFCPREVEHIKASADPNREFYRLWTMKESYMKMTGEGMSLGLDRFEVEFSPKVRIFRDGAAESCVMKEFSIEGYMMTVCAREGVFAEAERVSLITDF